MKSLKFDQLGGYLYSMGGCFIVWGVGLAISPGWALVVLGVFMCLLGYGSLEVHRESRTQK